MSDKPPAMPLWVRAFIVVVVILVLLFIGSMLLGVQHGPGMHSSAPGSMAAHGTTG